MATIYDTTTGEVHDVTLIVDGQDIMSDVIGSCHESSEWIAAPDGIDWAMPADAAAWWVRWADLEERINDALDGADALTLERHARLVDEYGHDMGLLHDKEMELLGIEG